MMHPNNGNWRILSLTLQPDVFFAEEQDALTLRACTPAGPPTEEQIRADTFHGLYLSYCAPVGSYQYQPRAGDRVDWVSPWGPGILWTTSGTAVDGYHSWLAERGAHLVIASANFWEGIYGADCYCDAAHVGFTLTVNAITGEVLRYVAGVDCAVC